MMTSQAKAITGGLSKPSKMPGGSYSIPAQRCITGSKLVQKEGSVCHGCYALKGMYRFPNVKAALERRFQAIDHPQWVEAMVHLVQRHKFFRWHDSGDLQSGDHLHKICEVCEGTPDTQHWLPTREVKIVYEYFQTHEMPANLCVRVSSPMIDGEPLPVGRWHDGLRTSTVVTGTPTCPAPQQGNKCGECRKCWSKEVSNVAYHVH